MDHELDSYGFDLPEELIAQHPAQRRDASRLMTVDRSAVQGETLHAFAQLPSLLPEGTLLVVNNSRVVPARLFGTRASGGRVEMLLLTPPPLLDPRAEPRPGWQSAGCEVLLRASKTLRIGEEITFGSEFSARIVGKGEFGRHDVTLTWQGGLPALQALLERLGRLPLPPYIQRVPGPEDLERYQTIYASPDKAGSVAAPTAGLHFTPKVREELARRGMSWAEVTLYVGYGTFSPVRCADIREHRMHKEWIEISPDAAAAISTAKAEGRPLCAVGTTAVRTLEGSFAQLGEIAPFCGSTDIFISPGFSFQVVDHMLTNFHLPLSSLIIMVSAFAGRARVRAAYARAIQERLRFFSYGDAMLIL